MAKPKKPSSIVITDVHLDDETQARLNAMARFLGRTPEGLAIECLEYQLLNGPHRNLYLAIKAGLEQAAGQHDSLNCPEGPQARKRWLFWRLGVGNPPAMKSHCAFQRGR